MTSFLRWSGARDRRYNFIDHTKFLPAFFEPSSRGEFDFAKGIITCPNKLCNSFQPSAYLIDKNYHLVDIF